MSVDYSPASGEAVGNSSDFNAKSTHLSDSGNAYHEIDEWDSALKSTNAQGEQLTSAAASLKDEPPAPAPMAQGPSQPLSNDDEKKYNSDSDHVDNRGYSSGENQESSTSRGEDGSALIPVSELDWDGPDDKDDPQNWSRLKKWWVTYTAAIMCLCCSLGSSLYTGAIPEIMKKFGASQELCLVGLTLYLIGLAIGPAVAAPLSELVGRKPVYVLSWPLGMLFIMGVGLARNIQTILVLRFFCGLCSSPSLSIAAGTISDVWSNDPSEQSFAVAIFCLCPFLGPVLGPIIGGFSAEYKNWQWPAAWVLLMFFGAIWPSAILCPETFKPVILYRRAKKRGLNVETPVFDLAFMKKVARVNLIVPVKLLVSEPIVMFMSIYVAFIFAVLFGFFEAFPVIFRGVYHMDLGVSGLPFLSVGIGLVLGVVFYVILDYTIYYPRNADGTRGKKDADGKPIYDPPETKLLVGKVGSIGLPIALFWLGWTSRPSVHWMAPVASGVPFGFGLILVFFSVVLYFSLSYPPIIVASAIAANNLLRYLLASVFPLFTVQCFENLGIGWAGTLFALISVLLVPLPFVFAHFGPRLRSQSKLTYAAYFKRLAAEKAQREQQQQQQQKLGPAPREGTNVEKNVANKV
ncbi:uncharacterized protein LODBEIA_P15440 [Lodderomyces beijingensis]|uniref:Major facilitator superfamily (MFS) profile domain-containing protein n=1 Tax=Lodderomyces beijingensis TaxID=1775926 RepID=A0ABP0ZM13_9ASCO